MYTMSNCLYSSLIERIEGECGCSPTFASRVTGDSEGRWCEGSELTCLENIMTHWGDNDHGLDSVYNSVTGSVDKCLSACHSQKVDVTTSSSSYPSIYTFPRRNDFCLVIRKIDKICQDNYKKIVFERHYRNKFSCSTFTREIIEKCKEKPRNVIGDTRVEAAATDYARENLALFKIFIRDPFYTKIKMDQRVSVVQFFGNVGGFLGLLTGLSVMSLVEIFYHCMALFAKLCKRK